MRSRSGVGSSPRVYAQATSHPCGVSGFPEAGEPKRPERVHLEVAGSHSVRTRCEVPPWYTQPRQRLQRARRSSGFGVRSGMEASVDELGLFGGETLCDGPIPPHRKSNVRSTKRLGPRFSTQREGALRSTQREGALRGNHHVGCYTNRETRVGGCIYA